MKVSIIVIGDELLLGQVVDTNSGDIARIISSANWQVSHVVTIGDNGEAIRKAVKTALEVSDLVITTGGLGPTKDDITKQVLMEFFGGELRFDDTVLENVKEVCRKRNIEPNELTRQQAMVPSSCEVIQNRVGTAPIMWFEKDGKVLVSLPGVPFEMNEMMRTEVFPRLLRRFGDDVNIEHRFLLIFNVIESEIAARLSCFEESLPPFIHLAYLPMQGYVTLRLDGWHADREFLNGVMDSKRKDIEREFGTNVIWNENRPLAEIALMLLRRNGLTVSTAESCSGGNVAHALTLIPGCSDCFAGGVISYSNEIKKNVLGVSEDSLELYGAVSLPVAEQMVEGVTKRVCHTECGISTTGIAGPGGATATKPVGTVCIAVKTPRRTLVDCYRFPGSRQRIIDRTTNVALIKLIRELKKLEREKKG
ncbi:MAG: CinA family nicotinamide mononucleotide deamidase-related protein [Muribaculaceae bacterium]|nr:CinA family nicotinamide mononucleotide deamidase-related protein [Muribaculaceae bacterium]